jgi:hypothetical protein
VLKTTCNCLKNRQNAFKQRRALYHSIYPQSIELTTQADFFAHFCHPILHLFLQAIEAQKSPERHRG